MSDLLLRWLLPATLQLAALAAQAQGSTQLATPPAHPDPLDPSSSVPTLNYRSAFAGYRAFSDDKPLPWREANEAVARIGGWRAYAREAQQPDAKPSGAPAPKAPTTPTTQSAPTPGDSGGAKPMPQGHSVHKSP